MAYVYNHMPEEIYADKKIGSTAKLVMQRIFSLSKDGAQTVFFNRDKFSVDLGLTTKSLSKAFQDLLDAGYLESVKNKNPFDRTRTFNITEKALFTDREDSSLSTEKNLPYRESKNFKIESEEITPSEREDSSLSTEKNLHDLHQIDHKERKEDVEVDSSAPLTFDSVFSQMVKINEEEFTPKGIPFTEEDIRSDARTYTMKFKGKPTRDSMVKWMTAGDERRSEQRKSQAESNQISTVQLPRKMTAAEIRAGLAKYEERFGHPGSPFYRGDPDYES